MSRFLHPPIITPYDYHLQNPKHPKAWLYLQSKLFDGIARFTDLEKIIADLPTPQEGGKGFGGRHMSISLPIDRPAFLRGESRTPVAQYGGRVRFTGEEGKEWL